MDGMMIRWIENDCEQLQKHLQHNLHSRKAIVIICTNYAQKQTIVLMRVYKQKEPQNILIKISYLVKKKKTWYFFITVYIQNSLLNCIQKETIAPVNHG